jgi:hypothetical protein
MDVVAGLVAKDGIVRATGVAGGAVVWSTDALVGVAWTPDAEIKVQAAAGGVAILWHGLQGGKPVRTLALLGPHGEPQGNPIEVGATFCGTADGLAWMGPHTTGRTRVQARRWSEPAARDALLVPPDRDPALVCGDHDVVVLGDGDDDLTASRFVPGADPAAPSTTVALRNADFADEEREHDAYSMGDDLGLVRVGTSGALALRELPRGGVPGSWRRLKHALSADDDVVTVDGDATATFVVVTHDADDTCAGAGSAESVRALRIDRQTGEESIAELAPADCERSPGPFWIATSPSGPIVAWVERRTSLPAKAASITGMVFRVLGADGMHPGRIDQAADALVEGGCDEGGCSVAALVREPGSDGTVPAVIRVFRYP